MRSRSPDLRTPPVSSIAACSSARRPPRGPMVRPAEAVEDAQRFELREPVDRLLPEALAEVVEVVPRAVIGERQDRDRVLCGERRRRSIGVPPTSHRALLKTGA